MTHPECGEHYPIGQEVRWKEGEKKASWGPEFSFLHFLIQYAVTSVLPPPYSLCPCFLVHCDVKSLPLIPTARVALPWNQRNLLLLRIPDRCCVHSDVRSNEYSCHGCG